MAKKQPPVTTPEPEEELETEEGETEREQFITEIANTLDLDDLADLIVVIAINEAAAEMDSQDADVIGATAELLVQRLFSDVSEALDITLEAMSGAPVNDE